MEQVTLAFTEDGLREMAQHACEMNERLENIGARRLHTIVERVLEEISFSASDHIGETISIDRDYVNCQLGEAITNVDLSRYIL
jgi:ATP-dependent HslUV protease ATP-binding subunit HslU